MGFFGYRSFGLDDHAHLMIIRYDIWHVEMVKYSMQLKMQYAFPQNQAVDMTQELFHKKLAAILFNKRFRSKLPRSKMSAILPRILTHG